MGKTPKDKKPKKRSKDEGLVVLSELPRKELDAMTDAGEQVIDCMRVLAKTGDNIVGELLHDVSTFYEWDHYPKGDVYDQETHSQYYYHAHPKEERGEEHGHFHTFLRPKGMPKGVKPAPVDDYEPPKDPDDALSHIVGVSMDKFGVPIALFTTNRWVTGEIWYAAHDVVKLIDRFDMDLAWPSWPVNRWVTAMLHLFRPQIVDLLQRRDARVVEWAEQHPGTNVFEDRDLELTSEISISIDDQMAALTAAREKAA